MKQESLADARVSAWQQCMAPSKSTANQRYAISYWRFIVTVAVLLTVSDIFSRVEINLTYWHSGWRPWQRNTQRYQRNLYISEKYI